MQLLYRRERRKFRMGIQKKAEVKKYYTWKGNVGFTEYHDYKEAQAAAKKMGQKQADPPGFVYREESEAFSKPCKESPMLLAIFIMVISSIKGVVIPILVFKISKIIHKISVPLIIMAKSGGG